MRSILSLALSSFVVAGCANAHETAVDGGPLPVGDAWVVDTSGEWCGSVQCAAGTTCCNPSCGICVPPGGGCIDLGCSEDAGPIARTCGGLAGRLCDPSEYCDYPDGSSCGGDDEEGICRPRPTSCPDPGGNLVCGCDGRDYVGDCSAYMSGTDIRRQGACGMPTPAHSVASATRTCGPTDGLAWSFAFADGGGTCPITPGIAELTIEVDRDIVDGTSGLVIPVGGTSLASAESCPAGSGGPPCFPLTGTMTIESFQANATAVISYSLTASDGTSYDGTNVTITAWCAGAPFCG